MSRALEPWDDCPPGCRWLRVFVTALAALSLTVGAAFLPGCQAWGQWGRGSCAPAGPVGPTFRNVASSTQTTTRTWSRWQQDPTRWYAHAGSVLNGDTLLGCYCPSDDRYWDWHRAARRWQPADVPADAPERAVAEQVTETGGGGEFPAIETDVETYNGGLDVGWVKTARPERLWHGSAAATLDDLIQSIENVPDYRAKPRLTVIGTDAARARVLADAKAAGLSELFLLSDRPREHWHNRDREGKEAFRVDGDPTLTLQLPDGRTLHSQAGYEGPADLAALRRASPDYDPAKDPDLRKPKPKPGPPVPTPGPEPSPGPTPPTIPALPGWAWVAALAAWLVAAQRK